MALTSMTGFAQVSGISGDWAWTWELRSVNGKGLDVRFRTGGGMDAAEQRWRKRVQAGLQRGNVAASLTLVREKPESRFTVNQNLLQELMAAARLAAPDAAIQPEVLLNVRGVIEIAEAADDPAVIAQRDADIDKGFDDAVDALRKARAAEGQHLAEIMQDLTQEIETLLGQAVETAELQTTEIGARLRKGVQELLQSETPLPEERLAQEIAIFIAKADVREEVDRLRAHVAQARELLASDGPVGRKFDFLAQEFNREANTLCSKSGSVDLTRIGLEMKLAIDRLREQVQNVE